MLNRHNKYAANKPRSQLVVWLEELNHYKYHDQPANCTFSLVSNILGKVNFAAFVRLGKGSRSVGFVFFVSDRITSLTADYIRIKLGFITTYTYILKRPILHFKRLLLM